MTAPGHADAGPAGPSPEDLPHLRRCVELAAEAADAGDFPFGSVLVAADGRVLAEDRNRENSAGDATRHPEIELAGRAGPGARPGRAGPRTAPPFPRRKVDRPGPSAR